MKVFQLSTQLYFQQAGRLLSGRPDPSERKTLGGDCFMLDSKSNILKIFYLHFSWSWRTTSEVLRSWPRVSAMSNQSTQIRGKSLLVSFIASERGGKKLIQDDLRLDTTRKDDLHYAERWSQDRGSLSPTTQSPQRSRFCNPPYISSTS